MEQISTIELALTPQSKSFQNDNPAFLGPFFQGAMMQVIDSGYADYLHKLPFNPYSQSIQADEKSGKLLWRVNVLTNESAHHILHPLQDTDTIMIQALGTLFTVEQVRLEQIPLKKLLGEMYTTTTTKVRLRFLTPTSFKSKGTYVIIPTVRLLFQNLLMRYEQTYAGSKEIDAETVAYLDEHTRITSYQLRSRYFPNIGREGRKIPAFVGSLALSFSGPQAVCGLANMLLTFGCYSGIGIKTSMGMGAIAML